ncbi:MAG: S8 family serine peptidase, partial [Saprospiraceae bacterium]
MHKLIYTLALLAVFQSAAAQQDYTITLQSGTLLLPEDLPSDRIHPAVLPAYQFMQHYYLLLQFSDIPTQEKLQQLQDLGVTLYHYVPNYAFVAKIPTTIDWSRLNARAVLPFQPKHKLAKVLAEGDYPAHIVSDSSLAVKVYPFPDIPLNILLESLKQNGFSGIIQGNGVLINVPRCCLLDLAGHPAVLFIEPKAKAPQTEGWTGRTAQRLNLFSNGPGVGFDGSGVSLAIGDDGKVVHEDFRGRLTDLNTSDMGSHGEMTAGLAIGAGNLNPLGMGMAPGANLYMYPIENYIHLDNAVAHLQQNNTVITSTSYGEGCGGIYTQDAQILDKQVQQNEVLLHFFSSGNAGEDVCSNYGNFMAPDGGRFGSITGGRKAAKNVLTVGNTAFDDVIVKNSSRGPAADGRIKPELCAHGQGNLSTDSNNGYRSGGGTSAAAPSLAGTAAVLYHAYRQWNNGVNPSSALIKATLLNTADDLGNAGPDYSSGFGRVNAANALELLQNNWYTTATITNGATRTHALTIPRGIQQLRVLLYWHDPEGLPNAMKALVNDLDIKLNTPKGETLLPWVLSTTAHPDSLNKSAYRGIDRINNVEQITLDQPEAGDYTINIRGNMVPKGPQKYVLVYYFIAEELKLTYPNGGEGLVPDETEVIRWDAFGNTGTFTLEYSINNGTNWQMLATNIPGHLRHHNWQVPKLSATQVKVRVSRNGKQSTSAAPFCILGLPDFSITPLASNTALITWQKVAGANLYDVYALGSKYMEVIGTVSDTFFQFNTTMGQRNWYSVRARHTNGATGRRATAQLYQHQTCDVKLTLQLNFDFYPSETSWDIQDGNGKIWAAGGPYQGATVGSSTKIDLCLPYGCYTFNMRDAYNDGMCCAHGQGSYHLTDASGKVLAEGGAFANLKTHSLCLQPAVLANVTIQVVSMKNVSCAGGRDGNIAIRANGGSGTYTYRWNTGATTPTLTDLSVGVYTVTVSDGIQQVFTSLNISQPSPITAQVSVQQNSCTENSPTTVTATATGGTPPYTFTWSNGNKTSTLTNIGAGTYTVTVTDANGCTQTAGATVANLEPLTTSVQSTNPTCANVNNGKASVIATGGMPPYQYNWTNAARTMAVNDLPTGTHSVTVTDSRGCIAINTVTLTAPEPLSLSFATVQASGTNNGAINLSVSGGRPDSQYRWSNGATTHMLTNLGPGTYI